MGLKSLFQGVSCGLALLRRTPCLLEFTAWNVGFMAVCHLYPYTWPDPMRACEIIIACSAALAIWCVAFRNRLDPVAVMIFGTAALLTTLMAVVVVAYHLFSAVVGPDASVVFTVCKYVFVCVFLVGLGITPYLALGVGIRKRRQRIPRVIAALKDKRWRVRRMAALTLGEIAYTERNLLQRRYARKTLRAPAQHDSKCGSTYAQAQDSLARLSSEGKPVLVELLQDTHVSVRREAAWAIKQIDRRGIITTRDLIFDLVRHFCHHPCHHPTN